MAINEKYLLKAMKNAAKHGDYKMRREGDQLILFAEWWYVHLDMDYISRSVLALLVEHTGRIPDSGEMLLVTLKDDPQTVMEDAIREEIQKWSGSRTEDSVVMSPVMYHGLQIFQTPGWKCYGVDPAQLEFMERDNVTKGVGTVLDGNRILWNCENGNVILRAARPSEDGGFDEWQNVWQVLESVLLK